MERQVNGGQYGERQVNGGQYGEASEWRAIWRCK